MNLRLDEEDLCLLDGVRGGVSREAWLRAVVHQALGRVEAAEVRMVELGQVPRAARRAVGVLGVPADLPADPDLGGVSDGG